MELKRKELSREAAAEEEAKKKLANAGAGRMGSGLSEAQGTPPRGDPLSGQSETGAAPDGDPRKKRSRKVVLFGIPALLLLLAVITVLALKFDLFAGLFGSPAPKLEPVTSIKRPVPIPDYREMADFLVLFDVEGQKMMTAFRMEFGFRSPKRHQNFKEQNVLFRETVYSFLLRQNLPRNSAKAWHSIIEKELLDYLKAKLPDSQAESIRLTQVENL